VISAGSQSGSMTPSASAKGILPAAEASVAVPPVTTAAALLASVVALLASLVAKP